MDPNLFNIDFNAITKIMTPPLNNTIDTTPYTKSLKITSAIDNIQNVNRLRDLDNLYFQIEMKKKQKDICKKRLKSIISTLDIKIGIRLSLIIISSSVVIPFIIAAFQEYLQQYQSWIHGYLIISFIVSMLSMCVYLLVLCLRK